VDSITRGANNLLCASKKVRKRNGLDAEEIGGDVRLPDPAAAQRIGTGVNSTSNP
jgi:hypothetical protein